MTPRDLARWRILDFGESYQITERKFHDYNKALTRFPSTLNAGFFRYVCDVGLWLRFIKYGST